MNGVTPELLERIARKRRFSSQTLEIAKRLFLYNEPVRGLSAEYGVNLARVYAIRDTVAQAAQEERVPPGWEEVTLVAPKALIAEFRARIAQAQAELTSGGAAAALAGKAGAVEDAGGGKPGTGRPPRKAKR